MQIFFVRLLPVGLLFGCCSLLATGSNGVARADQQDECQPKTGVIYWPAVKAKGNAASAEVLEGRTFSSQEGVNLPGTMKDNEPVSIIPGDAPQTIPQGYHDGSGTVAGDTDLVPANIKNGVTLFNVTGSCIEAGGTATPGQVLNGQTFSNDSGQATGTMTNVGRQDIMPGTAATTISQGYHDGSGTVDGDTDLVPDRIRKDTQIFEAIGTLGIAWGCRPGNDQWETANCLTDCNYYYPVSPTTCANLCQDLADTLDLYPSFIRGFFCGGNGDSEDPPQ